jgi:N-methylhydantoinase A
MTLLGIDTGGTFTDFVLLGPGGLRVHKVLSTPQAPERAILQGIRELGLDPARLRVVHGSTVATNAVLEGKGVRTAFVTNRGFADLLSIGRQARERLYDLQPPPRNPPVPPELCLETGGRLTSAGEWLEPLTADDVATLRERLRALAPEAVAVNLLFSFLDPAAERAIAAAVPEGVHVSLSSDVLPEIREYERGVATWLNAWVGPLVEGYLRRLGDALPGSRLSVMQSSGDTIGAAQASGSAVRLLLSGPAGGLRGARLVAELGGATRLLTFDMGGTSTDVALVDGDPRLTTEGRVAGYPVAVPMVDMHTIGAGGGSLAWLDAGGMLQVGPESAGADPGPACYGRGGTRPTVTDANLVLGRLRPDAFLGGAMPLDAPAARRSLEGLASAMNCTVEAVATGIVRLADEHMARALRVISVQRGVDPRSHTLVSFGGAGGLHVCALADALGLGAAMVPVHAGVLSALGMLATPPGRRLSRTHAGRLDRLSPAEVEAVFADLEAAGRTALREEGTRDADARTSRTADLRYVGQSYTLEIAWAGPAASTDRFHAAHLARYGHHLDLPVEVVNLRVAVTGPPLPLALTPVPDVDPAPPACRARLPGIPTEVPIQARAGLCRGQHVEGPAVVTEALATTWVAPGWTATVDAVGNLRLTRAGWPPEGRRV